MKTLAQQYQVLKNTIETIGRNCYFSMSTINKETIALVCEKLTLDFCEALPKDFQYEVNYHQSDVEVDIIANVKGDNKTFSVTTGMIERLGTNDCYFSKRLASYKESLNIEVLSENAQKLRLEKQEVAKEDEQQEVKSNTIIDAMNKLQKEYPNFEYVKLFFGLKGICNDYSVKVGEDARHVTQYDFVVKPTLAEVEEFNRLFIGYNYCNDYNMIRKNVAKESEQYLEEEQQEVEFNSVINVINELQKKHPNFERVTFFFDEDEACHGYSVMLGKVKKYIPAGNFIKPLKKEIEEANRLLPDFKCLFLFYGRQLLIKRIVAPIQEKGKQETKEELYSDIGNIKECLDIFLPNNPSKSFMDLNLDKTYFSMDEDLVIRLFKYNSDYSENVIGTLHADGIEKLVKLGMYIERRNQLNKK